MVVYTPEERRDAVAALEGSGIVASNIDTNLAGVLRMLVGELAHLRERAQTQHLDAITAAAANRQLVLDAMYWRQQLISAHQVIWSIAMRTDGQIRITMNEMREVPADPGLLTTSDPDGLLIAAAPQIPDGVEPEVAEDGPGE